MVSGDYVNTHEKILKCALKIFKEKGYEKSNLREICKTAGVTTGAFYGHFEDKEAIFAELVEPIVNDIEFFYKKYEKESFEVYESVENLTPKVIEEILEKKFKGSIDMVDYFFKHKNIYDLLINGSYGTKYVGFLDKIIEREDKVHQKILKMIYVDKESKYKITKKGLHIINHSYYYGLTEIALTSETIEEARNNAVFVSRFFTEGWKKMRGI